MLHGSVSRLPCSECIQTVLDIRNQAELMGIVGFWGDFCSGFLCMCVCVLVGRFFCLFVLFSSWAFIHMVTENIKVSQIENVNYTQEKKKRQSEEATVVINLCSDLALTSLYSSSFFLFCFSFLIQDSSKVYTTHVSYLEIYNECGYDLLDPRHEASRLEDLP